VNRIDALFERTRAERRAALIVFVTAGDPDLDTTAELVTELAAAGADAIELGVPHSDPIAEGPTIQASSLRALRNKTRMADVIELAGRARAVTGVPLLLMGYLNNALAHGPERLAAECRAAGVDGLILADTPSDELPELTRAARECGIHRISLIAPTTPPERLVRIAGEARGFVYCVSVTGVTGARRELSRDLGALVARVQRVTRTPVCVGFGIATPEHVREIGRLADGAIVGSALVERIAAAGSPRAALEQAGAFVRTLAGAAREARS
jgi:tryptophan synthase alpha chain